MSSFPVPDHMFDGGDLDCGSGLVLLIRENMLKTPIDGVLEMRSREATVADDLPPWCRMVGHDYLGNTPGDNCTRYFIRRGAAKAAEEEKALAEDKKQAREYEWRLRIRATGHLKSTVYCRNFSWDSGQPASFEEKDVHPCGVEQLFGALGASLCSGYATECAKSGLEMDDIEITVRGKLNNVLAHLGLEEEAAVTFIRALPHMDYVSLIDRRERTRLSEGEAARLWGRGEDGVERQFYFATRNQPFAVREIIGGRKVREHLRTHGISPGCSLVLESIEQTQELHKPGSAPVTISSPSGLRLYLNRTQAGQVVVKSDVRQGPQADAGQEDNGE